MKKKLFTLGLLVFISGILFAQRNCGAMDYLEKQKVLDPQLEERMRIIEIETQEYIKQNINLTRAQAAVVTIPVVFHVVYNNTTENISDQRIFDQLKSVK